MSAALVGFGIWAVLYIWHMVVTGKPMPSWTQMIPDETRRRDR